jgi:hypothetical protein
VRGILVRAIFVTFLCLVALAKLVSRNFQADVKLVSGRQHKEHGDSEMPPGFATSSGIVCSTRRCYGGRLLTFFFVVAAWWLVIVQRRSAGLAHEGGIQILLPVH